MNWNKKKILITGAGGFIGSHLTEALVKLNADVHAFIRYNSRNFEGFIEDFAPTTREKITVHKGDLLEERSLKKALINSDIVFHLAANPGIPYSFLYPTDVFMTNAVGSMNLLNAANELGIKRIILASSAETYGNAKYLPLDEDHPQLPRSPYAASKAAMEKMALSFYYAYQMPITIVRLFNNYGPRQSARAIIPTIISQLIKNNKVCLGSLYPIRDFTFVLDTVDAFIRIAECNEAIGEIINIGSGIEISVEEILKKITLLMNKEKVEIITDKARIRPGDSEVDRLRANNSKLKKLTNWAPKTHLDEGLNTTIDWLTQKIDSYKPEIYNI